MNKLLKKVMCGALTLGMCLSLSGCQKKATNVAGSTNTNVATNENADNPEFNTFLEQEFKDSLEADYSTYHYDLVDPEALGITKPEITLGNINDDEYQNSLDDATASLAALEAFDYDSLSFSQQVDYDAYKYYLENAIELGQYKQFDMWFAPSIGIQDNLNTNFDEFVFRKKEDIDDYLVLIADYDNYLDQALQYTVKQASGPYFLQDFMIDASVDAIDEFTERVDDNALIVSFDDRIDGFEGLTDQEKEDYKKQNADIVTNQLIPAYENVADTLDSLKGTANPDKIGLGNYEGGADYYAALVKHYTSSEQSIDEMYSDLETYIMDCTATAQEAYKKNNAAYAEALSFVYEGTDPMESLKILEDNMYTVVPKGADVTYTASFLDQSIASDSVNAYYLNPPLDEISDNVIRINEANMASNPTEMFATLGHEGFPGHCYQTTYYLNQNPNKIRGDMYFMGYGEGWAMHAELYSFNWIGFKNAEAADIYSLDTTMGYALAAMTDIGINYYNWTVQDLADLYTEYYGYNLTVDDVKDQYEYIAGMPGVILSYGVGMMKMENLEAKVKEAFGDKFNDIDFNTVILNYGGRPFALVERDIDKYIEINK